MRWNMYTRTLGYRMSSEAFLKDKGKEDKETKCLKLDKKDRDLALVHDDLVEFEQLPYEVQVKDAIVLDEEIVKILESI